MKKRKMACCLALGILISFLFPVYSSANSTVDLQNFFDNEKLVVFLPNMGGEISSSEAQIGSIMNTNVDIFPLDGSYSIHTTILFDNSLSISKDNRSKMKEIVKGIVQNHAPGEKFSLYTMDTELRLLVKNSEAYDELAIIADGISFANQETYLKNILYDVIRNVEQDNVFHRFIILSDGADDSEISYTFNDIARVLDDKHYAVCAIGSKNNKKPNDLEEMFSIARMAMSFYFTLEKDSDVIGIVQSINAELPQFVAKVSIPDMAKDGRVQRIKIVAKTSSQEYVFYTSAEMPFLDIVEVIEEPKQEDIVDDVIISEIVEEPIQQDRKFVIPLHFFVPSCFLFLVIGFFVIYKVQENVRGKKRLKEIRRQEDADDDESTVYMDFEKGDEHAFNAKTVILKNENSDKRYEFICSSKITIGRKSECDVQITDDKSVSGVHCIIFCDEFSNPAIRDNESLNGTYLNDEKLVGKKLLESGDSIEIGRTRYLVQIRGE